MTRDELKEFLSAEIGAPSGAGQRLAGLCAAYEAEIADLQAALAAQQTGFEALRAERDALAAAAAPAGVS